MSVDGSEQGKAATAGQASDPPKVVEEKSAILITADAAGRPVTVKFIFFRKITTRVLNHATEMAIFGAFIGALVVASVATGVLFRPTRVLNPVNWVLAFSIYGGAFTGFVISIIEGARHVKERTRLNWSSPTGFIWYNIINGSTGLAAFFFVTILGAQLLFSPAPGDLLGHVDKPEFARLILNNLQNPAISGDSTQELTKLISPIDKPSLGHSVADLISLLSDETLRSVVKWLAGCAFIVILFYSVADLVAYNFGGDKKRYFLLLWVDGIVLFVHVVSLVVIHFSDSFPITVGFAVGPRDAFMGGCMALSLLGQSGAFALMESRLLDTETRERETGNAKA